MALKRTKIDLSIERQILTGMIISDRFLREILPLYEPDLFEIKYGPIVAKWCIQHFEKYEKAPGALIQDIFAAWERSNPEQEQADYIHGFLATLSDEYERSDKFNAPYLIDKAVEYFDSRSYKLLEEDLRWCNENNDREGAAKVVSEFRKVEKVMSPGIDVFDDEDAWRDAFDVDTDTLFTVPGKLGEMINPQFVRESFIGLMGIAKIGKTWNLNFLAQCAVRARCNVAFFQLGDLSQNQMMIRNGIYITQRSNKPKYCGVQLIPVLDCEKNQKDMCDLRKRQCKFGCYDTDGNILDLDDAPGYTPCTECRGEHKGPFKGAVWHEKRRPVRPLTWQEAYKAAQEYKQRIKAKRFKLSTHPSKSLNVVGVEAILDNWERLEGWVPDVLIFDYADLFAPERKGNKETRDDSNETWMALSALRQKRKCCVITATQANGAAIKEKTVGREHYANDRRKYDHVTAMYGLSQTSEEKRKGIIRWGEILVREDDFDCDYQVNVLGCLAIGRPYLESF